MRRRRAAKIAAAELTDAKPTAKPKKPKQRYYATDARRAYMRDLMRRRRAAAKGA